MNLNNNKVFIWTILIIVAIGITNIFIKKDLLILFEALAIIFLIGIYVYINETRLFLFSFWTIMLSKLFSQYIPQAEYSLYIFIIILILKLLEKKIIRNQKLKCDKLIIVLTSILFIINIISVIYNGYSLSISLILFSALKKFSFIILYIFYLNADISSKSIILNFKIMFIFALLQFPILVIQYLLGTIPDDIAGMFGTSGTGILLQYFINIMILLPIINRDSKKIKMPSIVFAAMILFYCAISEVKFGFIVVPFIYVLSLILEGKYLKTILNSIILIFTLGVIYGFFISIYPEHDFLNNVDFSEEYLETAYGNDAVNRSDFMPLLNRIVLQSKYKRAFGTGLGTVNPSSRDSLEGPVAKEYSYMNIHFFSLPYSIIENGIIGTIVWIVIYIYILLSNLYIFFKERNSKTSIIILICLVTFIFIYYNSSIITSNIIITQVWFILTSINSEKIKGYSIEKIKKIQPENKILSSEDIF